ncbi:MAG TPA: neutral/alkaline non-lysosomal ceramidase N-terminal domain-containing protein, partial [Phycisphaerae bacterium]|nr:neutral/alkaline non-lysosomal ceramidase N-terminal domain-containing protein [Phycisphaerae bacterium]
MSGLLVGIAQVDYTPRPGLPLMGNFREDYGARGVHDPLYAKAVVFESPAGQRFAMLAVDVCMMDRHNVAMMRESIASRCGLAPDRILIAATHTHSGPAPMMLGSLPKAPDEDVREFLTQAATAVVAAVEDLRPATVLAGHGREERLSFNRRLRCRDGATHMNWERLDPSFVVEPLGPIDPHIGTLRIDREGRPTACVVNFGLHPAILAGDNWLYSADYPGYLAEAMRRLHGPAFVTLFVNGPCGNVNHIDYRDPLEGRGYKMAERVGYMLAVGAEEAAAGGACLKGDTVAVRREGVPLRRLRISEDERRW